MDKNFQKKENLDIQTEIDIIRVQNEKNQSIN